MKSIRLQLLVTLVAVVVAAGFFVCRGLPPKLNLCDAVDRSDIAHARQALAWGADPNFWAGRRLSNLSNALEGRDEAMVRLLIAYGVDVNAPVIGPSLPFQLACSNNMPETAKLLILAGQDVNRSYRHASSPLQCASASDYPELVTFILERGAAPDCRNDLEWTALHEACFYGKPEAVKGVFIAIGLHANAGLVADLVELNDRGEVVVGTDCSISRPGLFAAGDVTSVYGKRIIIAAGEGAKAALAVKQYLVHQKAEKENHA